MCVCGEVYYIEVMRVLWWSGVVVMVCGVVSLLTTPTTAYVTAFPEEPDIDGMRECYWIKEFNLGWLTFLRDIIMVREVNTKLERT